MRNGWPALPGGSSRTGSPLATAIRSIYRWEGTVHDEPEARVALHTRASLVPRIVERADTEHPYDVPCVIALPVVDGNPAYVAWVLKETSGDGL